MSKKILVVDDNPFMCKVLESRLSEENYKVIIAYDGVEALDKVQKEKIDLILLDITMPNMDGFEFGAKLKENPAISSIPIIMVTAHAEHSMIVRAATELGIKSYIVKPFKPEQLLNEVRKNLGEWE